MLARIVLFSLLSAASASAAAESVAVLVVSAADLTQGQQQQLVDATEGALREASALKVKDQGRRAVLTGPNKRCGSDVDCLVGLGQALKTDHALMLSLAFVGGELKASGFWVDVARRKATYKQAPAGRSAELDDRATALVEAALPGFLRRGWGGLDIAAEAGAIVKVDGRKVATTPLETPLALSEGEHEVDVVYATGGGVLHRVKIEEGQRHQIDASFAAMPSGDRAAAKSDVLQTVSYGVWSAGAIAVAGSFVAGALAARAASDVRACAGADRSCTNYLDAQLKLRQSQELAGTANVLLVSGAVLMVGGAGVFAWDLMAGSAK